LTDLNVITVEIDSDAYKTKFLRPRPKQAVGRRLPQYAPPRLASGDMIYIIYASGSVTNSMSMLPVQPTEVLW